MSGTLTGQAVVTLSDGTVLRGTLTSSAAPPPPPPPSGGNRPGAPTNLSSPAQTSSTITIAAGPPSSGGALDFGEYRVQFKEASASSWSIGPTVPYCSPAKGNVTDAFGNVWTIVPSGGPQPDAVMVNGSYGDGYNATSVLLCDGQVFHVNKTNQWYSFRPTGRLTGNVAWRSAPGQPQPVITQLKANTQYNVTMTVTNSSGESDKTSQLNVSSAQTGTVPPTPPPSPPSPPAPPPPSTGDAPPSYAAAVGYTRRTHGPAVTLGQNWFVIPGQRVRQNSDGSVTDPGPGGGSWHYNSHIDTATNHNSTFRGVGFGGGGYFEIDMLIENPLVGYREPPQSGWPAWWCDAVEGGFSDYSVSPGPSVQHIEFDAAEFMAANNREYSAGIIHWSDAENPNWRFNSGVIGQDSTVRLPSNNNFGVRHKYGWLWVPATANSQGYIKNYYDRQQVGQTYTWTPYVSGNKAQDPGDPPWSIIDRQHMHLMIGTCNENPMTIYTVTVWQKDDSKNLRVGVSLPT